MDTPDAALVPDDKDWTWTLQRPCPDCRFSAADVRGDQVAGLVALLTAPWTAVLARPDARTRPQPQVWSPMEYAAHVRDVCRVFGERLGLMLAEDEPQFANWDQDAAAVESDYAGQDPATVAVELAEAANGLSEAYAGVAGDQWQRLGVRSNGSQFTVLTLGQYCLHDLAHHVWDARAQR